MKKKLFLSTGFAFMCLLALPAMADCVCGSAGCKPCDDSQDYLEDVGKHMKKQAKRLNKHIAIKKQAKAKISPCADIAPQFWEEEAEVLDKNGNVILYYADLVEEDTVALTADQQAKAKTDAASLKQAGQKLKENAAKQKAECAEILTSVSEEVIPVQAQNGKHKKMIKSKRAQGELVWLDAMEKNGDMLIEVGDFIDTNMTK